MHVGGLQLFQPADGETTADVRRRFDECRQQNTAGRIYLKRPRRSITSLGQWGWEIDRNFDLEHHVRSSALPEPGRVRELLALCSRLHSTLLDRHRPPWELHLIEGLDDGRFAMYFKVHHALVDGVSALRLLSRSLSDDPDDRNVPPPWAPRERPPTSPPEDDGGRFSPAVLGATLRTMADVAGLVPAFGRTLGRGLADQGGTLSFSAPKTMLNVPITGARRFAAQSWPIERIKRVGKEGGATVNDVVLAMCSGALRRYLMSQDALPDAPLIAMVPVSLHGDDAKSADGSGNALGLVMCNLATDRPDAGDRLAAVHHSMVEGKQALRGMSSLQILAMSALGIAPLAVYPLLKLDGRARPPFNLVISNVPGPRKPLYWNGARLDGLYPLSVVLDGQALNMTVTSYSDEIAFGLTGCRRSVPHLQYLLGHLDDELGALENAMGLTRVTRRGSGRIH